jgi:hypothetical protein
LNINEVWFAHKIRNKIAHEINPKISEKDFIKAEKVFQKEIRHLIK